MNKAVFLDRDGIINRDKGYVYKIEDFEFIYPIFDVCRAFQQEGYLLIVITNQAGIGRGYYTEEDFDILNSWMLDVFIKQDIRISKVYFDATHPDFGLYKYKTKSFNRKPNPGMIFQAQLDFNLDLTQCILIGDKCSDIQAGKAAGVGINILVNPDNDSDHCISVAEHFVDSIDKVMSIFQR